MPLQNNKSCKWLDMPHIQTRLMITYMYSSGKTIIQITLICISATVFEPTVPARCPPTQSKCKYVNLLHFFSSYSAHNIFMGIASPFTGKIEKCNADYIHMGTWAHGEHQFGRSMLSKLNAEKFSYTDRM